MSVPRGVISETCRAP